jgi:hypothetical protein
LLPEEFFRKEIGIHPSSENMLSQKKTVDLGISKLKA